MIEVENILFDFNGTIVDDVDLCLELLNTMLQACNHPKVALKKYLDIFDFPVIEYYKKAGFVFPNDDFPKLADYFIEEYGKRNVECQLIEGVKETLLFLKNKGKKIYIVSASEIVLLKNQLSRYDLLDFFDGISGLDNIYAASKIESAKIFIKKSNIDIEKSVFVGDTLHDAEVARELGMRCVLVAKGHQSKERLLKSDAIVVDSMMDLIKIVV